MQKVYRHHTLYPGGLRETSVTEMFAKHPERVIELAVKGMLPKNKLGKAMAKKLKFTPTPSTRTRPSSPQALDLTSRKSIKRNRELRGRYNCGRNSILRNRTTQNFDRASLSATRRRRSSGQSQAFRSVLSQRNVAHDHPPAAAVDRNRRTSLTSSSMSAAAARRDRRARFVTASPAR